MNIYIVTGYVTSKHYGLTHPFTNEKKAREFAMHLIQNCSYQYAIVEKYSNVDGVYRIQSSKSFE